MKLVDILREGLFSLSHENFLFVWKGEFANSARLIILQDDELVGEIPYSSWAFSSGQPREIEALASINHYISVMEAF